MLLCNSSKQISVSSHRVNLECEREWLRRTDLRNIKTAQKTPRKDILRVLDALLVPSENGIAGVVRKIDGDDQHPERPFLQVVGRDGKGKGGS